MNLSGSLYMSGSWNDIPPEELPVASLFFERDGSMKLIIMSDADEKDSSSILLVAEYFQYALSKPKWMNDFADSIFVDKNEKKNRKKKVPYLRVIEGGKSQITGSIEII